MYRAPLYPTARSPWSNLDKTMVSSCTVRKFLVLLKAQQQILAFQGCETEESYSLIRFLVCLFVVVVFFKFSNACGISNLSSLFDKERKRARLPSARARKEHFARVRFVNEGNS